MMYGLGIDVDCSTICHSLLYENCLDKLQRRRMSDDIQQRAAADLLIVNLHVNDGDLQNYVLYELEMLLSSNSNSSSLSEYGLHMPLLLLLAQLKNMLLMEERNYNRVTLTEEHAVLVSKDCLN
nr:DNA helicase [Tanacetum cinerariifolium]